MDLNQMSLDVWYQYLKEEKYQIMSDRILFLNSQDFENNTEEKDELKVLLKLEKKLLNEANKKVDHNSKVIRKLAFYKNHLGDNERLLFIFLDRVKNKMMGDITPTEEIISEIYHLMMEEDMDIKGHDNLNLIYDKMIMSSADLTDVEELKCGNSACIYCKDINDEEIDLAYDDLLIGGYINDISEETLVHLMVLINRLEDEVAKYVDIDCDLEFDILDEDNDEDDKI